MPSPENDGKNNNIINLHEQKRLRQERGYSRKNQQPWSFRMKQKLSGNKKAKPNSFWPFLQLIVFVAFLAFAIRNCH